MCAKTESGWSIQDPLDFDAGKLKVTILLNDTASTHIKHMLGSDGATVRPV